MTGAAPKQTLPIIHVHPENDDRKHRLDSSGECWCNPTRTNIGGVGVRVSHNSADGREFIEVNMGELLAEGKTWGIKRIN